MIYDYKYPPQLQHSVHNLCRLLNKLYLPIPYNYGGGYIITYIDKHYKGSL